MKNVGTFFSTDGKSNVYWTEWVPEGEIKGIVQIVHGMAEYVDRYAGLAEYLNQYGILVAGNDHIGHGHSADEKDYGYFGKKGGWNYLIEDVEELRKILADKYPGVPYVILGHSMGSFITRNYLSRHGGKGLSGAIIEGTAGPNPALGAGMALAKFIRSFSGPRYKSWLIQMLAFGSYAKGIEGAKTTYDWLTRDDAVVQEYIEDDRCGFTFTLSGFIDLFTLLKNIDTDEWYQSFPKSLPAFFIAGSKDPVGACGEGPTYVANKLKDLGCKTELKIYEGMRHELHNEIGKEEVYEDIKNFVESVY